MGKVAEFVGSFVKWVVIVLVGIASVYVICWAARTTAIKESEEKQIVQEEIQKDEEVEITKEADYNIVIVQAPKIVQLPDNSTYLCPYCHEGLSTFSSSYLTSSAQMICHHCEYRTPQVTINRENAEAECVKKLKEKLQSNDWKESDFVGQ